MNRLLLITARGGSKGLPGKNILPLGGKPLIAWSIEQALDCGLGPVIVSTDSEEIAAVSRAFGAEVPFLRPAELATDTASSVDVAEHALEWFRGQHGLLPEILVLLQPTGPFRRIADITAAVAMVEEGGAPAAIGVCEAHPHPWMTRRMSADGTLHPFCEIPKILKQRQDFPPAWNINGTIYVIRSSVLLEGRTFLPPGTVGHVMPVSCSIDIDTREDLEFANFLVSRRT